jgi:hypothetical protein
MTLAWRLLEHREFERRWPMYVSPVQSKDVPPAPAELTALSTPDLFNEVTRLQAEIRPLTIDIDPASLPERLKPLLNRKDAGVFHLVASNHGAGELITDGWGGSHFSLTSLSYSLAKQPDVALFGTDLRVIGGGGLIDLGPLPLEATKEAIATLPQPLVELLYLPPTPDERDFPSRFRSRSASLEQRPLPQLPATPGHTYLLRSHRPAHHDFLAAIELVAWTPSGALFAFQVLYSWPLLPR